MFPYLSKQCLRNPASKWRFRVSILKYSTGYHQFQYTMELSCISVATNLSDPNAYTFPVQFFFFLKITRFQGPYKL